MLVRSHAARQPWDLIRFGKTLQFFDVAPNPLKMVQQFFSPPGQGTPQEGASVVTLIGSAPAAEAAPADKSVVLVTGATGGVGSKVVAGLLRQGRNVRAVVRDLDKAKAILGSLPSKGGRLEVVAADLSQAATLQPQFFANVRAVVSCSAVKVRPKEAADEDERESKYKQGIKFYDPKVIGDTPETVELGGMRNLLAASGPHVGYTAGSYVLDAATREGFGRWGELDDVVMGGASSSQLVMQTGAGEGGGTAAVFKGVITTANNGGFTSVRTKNYDPPLDWGTYEGLELRLRGNGLRYKVTLRTNETWDGVGYNVSFDTTDGEWQTIRLPFSTFKPVFRAKSEPTAPPLDPSRVYSVQIMLSKFEYDGDLNPSFREGSFEVPFQYIKAYMKEPLTPRIVHCSSGFVTRWNRPGLDLASEPPTVQVSEQLGGLLRFKLAAEDALRASGVPFTIVRPNALTEEPPGMPVKIDQGDDMKGKISREDVARLLVAMLDTEAASDVTFEVSSTVPFSEQFAGDEKVADRDWGALVTAAGLRQGVTGKTIDGVYTGKMTEAEAMDAAAKESPLSAAK